MSSFLYSLGRWAYRRRWLVVALWAAVLAAAIAAAGLLSTGTDNTYVIPGTESQNALDDLARTFPQVTGTSAQMIVVVPSGHTVRDADVQSAITDEIDRIAQIPQVQSVGDPYSTTVTTNISDDGSAALIPIQLTVASSAVEPTTSDGLQDAGVELAAALPQGSQVAVGGQLFSQTPAAISVTELLGLAVALLVLLFTFGSIVAAGMPLITALVAVGVSLSAILAMTRVTTVTSTAPLLALMLGLAVGIDYALFLLSRHRDQLREGGVDPEESAARSVATAGSAVVFAALTVIIALLGLAVARIPFLTTMGVAAAFAVAMAVLVSLTLVPALLGFAGRRVLSKRLRPDAAQPAGEADSDVDGRQAREAEGAAGAEEASGPAVPTAGADAAETQGEIADSPAAAPRGFFGGWVRAVTRWPALTVVVIVLLLGAAAVPAANLRLSLPDAGSLSPEEPARIAYDLISEHFGPGFNGPLLVTGSIIQSQDPAGLMTAIGQDIAAVPGVAVVPLSTPNQDGDTGIVQVISDGSPDSVQTEQLVATLRSMHDGFQTRYGVDLSVTGYTAAGIDISARLAGALLPFAILVVGLSLILLAMVFRSIVVPVTAALGYLLSIGAAFGVASLVYMNGVLAGPLHVHALGSVISFMPIILMGVLFGLAMDYEVFLVSRMREDFVHHHDARGAVHRGFVGSARVVTAAAVIMFAVFAAFVPEGDTSIQPIALGLAVGVVVDAFLVRMMLIPAVLTLFGDHAWWFPRWLERSLPSFDVEGEALHRELAMAQWPEHPAEIAAEHLAIPNPGGEAIRDVSIRVPRGEVLLVQGPPGSGRTRLLLTLAGRLRTLEGRAKVAGLALPMRAGGVRARVGVARLAEAHDPVQRVRLALSHHPRIVVIDDLDAVRHPELRDEIGRLLSAARTQNAALTLALSCDDLSAVLPLLPADAVVCAIVLPTQPVTEHAAAVPDG